MSTMPIVDQGCYLRSIQPLFFLLARLSKAFANHRLRREVLPMARLCDRLRMDRRISNLLLRTLTAVALTIFALVPLAFAQTLYVSNGTISQVSNTGAVSSFAGSSKTSGLVFDNSGMLYAADKGTNSLNRISATGKLTAFATGLNQPFALAYDATFGDFYVTTGSAISKVSAAGVVTAFVSGVGNPYGLAFDTVGGFLYSTDILTFKVYRITRTGVATPFVTTGLNSPAGIALDPATGELFVANAGNGVISRVTSGGSVTAYATGLNLPEGLAYDAATCALYAGNTGNGTISKIGIDGVATSFAVVPNPPVFIALQAASPEPSALGLLLGPTGFAMVSILRRRRLR
jgi:hypothetical protein